MYDLGGMVEWKELWIARKEILPDIVMNGIGCGLAAV
jgi:hypothetical protein